VDKTANFITFVALITLAVTDRSLKRERYRRILRLIKLWKVLPWGWIKHISLFL